MKAKENIQPRPRGPRRTSSVYESISTCQCMLFACLVGHKYVDRLFSLAKIYLELDADA